MGGLKIVELIPDMTQEEEKEWMIELITFVILENMQLRENTQKNIDS